MPDGTNVVAATAACVAAVLVAWQSWETRKSARASQKAAEAAAAGLETANNALDVARREESHSRMLVSEAQRARIDAALPAISVLAARDVYWPPVTSSNLQSGSWTPCGDDESWSLPSDAGKALGVQGEIHFHNGSQKLVELRIDYTPADGGPRVFDDVVALEPGARARRQFLTWARIGEWAQADSEGWLNFEGRLPTVGYSDHLDSGVGVEWMFALGPAAPIYESDEREPGRYRLVTATPSPGRHQPPRPSLYVERERRSYWLDRLKGIELPAPGDAA